MAIDLVTQYQGLVDEKFSAESKRSLVTNKDYKWTGAHSIKIYKVSTAEMNDYGRNGGSNRYGTPEDLDATTEEMVLKKIGHLHLYLINWIRMKQDLHLLQVQHLKDR